MSNDMHADSRSRQAVVDYHYQWSPVTSAVSACVRSADDVTPVSRHVDITTCGAANTRPTPATRDD